MGPSSGLSPTTAPAHGTRHRRGRGILADERRAYRPVRTHWVGRHRIVCDPVAVDAANVSLVLGAALVTHAQNAADIQVLHDYYLGHQSILGRPKDVRPEIDNRVVENRADEIVCFKVGYLVGDPVKYVSRPDGATHGDLLSDADGQAHGVSRLNNAMEDCGKHAVDRDIVQWAMECGVGYRLTLPTGDVAEPLLVRSLDPRGTLVVYANDARGDRMMSATATYRDDGSIRLWTVYTDRLCMELDGESLRVLSVVPHACGAVPVVEYPANSDRTGCFEKVLPLLDAINEVESDRVNGVQQFVQSLMVLKNVDLGATPDERRAAFDELRDRGAIQIFDADSAKADIALLTAELSQQDTQTLVDHLYKTVLRIVGMPSNIGGAASTSDTGIAVTLRDGWSLTETRAKDYELFFKRSERQFLRMACSHLRRTCGIRVEPSDVEISFTRRNYENTQGKAQVYVTLVQNGVPPTLAAEVSGISPDPEAFGDLVRQWSEARQAQANPADASAEGDTGGGPAAAGEGDATPRKKQTQ